MGHRLLFRALRRSMTACFVVLARDYAIFQIYHRIDHQYSVQRSGREY